MSYRCAAESQFSPKVAERTWRRYRRRGADAVTRLMLAQLRRCPLQDKELLNIGSGIGVINSELAADGIAAARLVEASPAYLEVARRAASTYSARCRPPICKTQASVVCELSPCSAECIRFAVWTYRSPGVANAFVVNSMSSPSGAVNTRSVSKI